MARRKAKKVVVKKVARPKLDSVFSCPFCNEEAAVECKMYVLSDGDRVFFLKMFDESEFALENCACTTASTNNTLAVIEQDRRQWRNVVHAMQAIKP